MDNLNEALDELLEALKNMKTVMQDVNDNLEDSIRLINESL